MSIEDPRLSSIDNTSAVDEFDSAVEQHLGFVRETVDGIEVAQAETPDTGRTDRLPAQAPVETAAAVIPGEISPDAENVVTLPAGIELDNLEFAVEGDNLVLVLADGTEIVVLGGAANIPTFVIGDVELPQVALFAALEGSNINVAAGPDGTFSAQGSPSSSRNFTDNPIDAGPEDLALADLLGDTDFGDDVQGNAIFGGSGTPSIPLEIALTEPFIYDEAVIADDDTGNQIITGILPFNPGPDFGTISRVNFAGAINVDEEGLGPQILTGFTSGGRPITVTSFAAPADGADLDFVALEGRDSEGTLVFTLTITNRETGAFEFELIGKLDHPDAGADGTQDDLDDLLRLSFTYTVTDLDGDSVTGSFSIDVMDDAPTFGEADAGAVDEDYLYNGNIDGEGDSDGLPPKGDVARLFEVSEPSSGGAYAAGSLGINWGADNGNTGGNAGLTGATGDRGVAFTQSTLDALILKGLKSDGVTLQYAISADGTTIVAYKPYIGEPQYAKVAAFEGEGSETELAGNMPEYSGEPVFIVSVSDIATNGTYEFNLVGNIDHPDTSTEDDVAIDFAFTVQDSDGDTASSSFTVTVNDDSPIAEVSAVALTVAENDIKNRLSIGSDPFNQENGEDSRSLPALLGVGFASTVSGELASSVSFGADGAAAGGGFSFTSDAISKLNDMGLLSKGSSVVFTTINGVIVGYVNNAFGGFQPLIDRPVMSIQLDKQTGEFVFRLYDQLDHVKDSDVAENTVLATKAGGTLENLDFGKIIQATDGDGDRIPLDGKLVITIKDDIPELSGKTEARTVDEDDIRTSQSLGTSPADGQGDGSWTGGPGQNGNGGAFIDGSLAYLVKGGADDTVKFSFIDEDAARDALEALGLKSKGQELSYDIRDGVLYAFDNAGPHQGVSYDNGDRLVFKLTLGENGSYTFELVDQLDHDKGKGQNTDLQDGLPRGDVEAIDFGSIIKFTDFDGDSVVLKGAFSVTIRDDVPELSGAKISRTVDEDDIRTSQSLGTSPADGQGDGSWTGGPGQNGYGGAFIDGSLAGLVKGGADDTVKFSFVDEDAARDALEALGLKSKGQELSYDIRDGVLYAFDNAGPHQGVSYDNGDRLVFKLTLGENGSYTFELVDQLDHDTGKGQNTDLQDGLPRGDVEAIDFGSIIKVTDFDGDSVVLKGAFSVTIRDDVPEAVARNTSATLVVDETSGQQNDDLGYSLSLFNTVANKGTDPNMAAQYARQTNFVAADIDGGADDDVKVDWSLKLNGSNGLASGLMTTEGRSIMLFLEGDLIVGRYDSPSDGNTSVNSSDPAAFALHLSDNGTLSLVQYVSIRHDDPADHDEHNDAADGNLSTVLQTLAGKINAVLTVTDFDGDKAVSEIAIGDRIQFEDDGPVASGAAVTKTADEDDLYNAQSQGTSPDGDSELALLGLGFAATVRGSIGSVVNFGADGAAAGGGYLLAANAAATMMTLGLESKGGDLSYQVFGNAILAYVNGGNSAAFDSIFDRPVFSLELDPQTGDFVYRQYDQLDHVAGGAENTALHSASGSLTGIDFGAIIDAKDGDGDTVNLTGKLTINVVDDVPEVAIWTDRTVTIDETDYRQNDDTTSQTVAAQFAGVLRVGSDIDMLQSPIFAKDDVVDLSYVTGADENVTKSLTLQIDNAASGVQTTSGQDIVLFLEGGLVVGRVGGAQGVAAFAIAIDSDGGVSVAQYMSLKHPNTGNADEGIDLTGKISAVFSVKDFDGDTVTKSVSIGNKIVFEDDGPTVGSNALIQLDDDALAGGNPGGPSDDVETAVLSGTLSHEGGADGVASILWAPNGINVPYGFWFELSADSKTMTITQNQGGSYVPVFKAVITDTLTGAYEVTQLAPVMHSQGTMPGTEDNVQIGFQYRVTDGDGDVATGTLNFNVDDDTPKAGANATIQLDDDALAYGNAGGTGDDVETSVLTGILAHSGGADGTASVLWAPNGLTIPYGFWFELSADSKTMTITQDQNGTYVPVFKAVIIDASTGAYQLTQLAPVDHKVSGTEDNLEVSFQYRVTDKDGDVDTGTLTVNIDDDTPTGGAGTTAWLNDDALTGGNPGGTGDNGLANTSNVLKHSFGADGAGSIAWTGISVVGGGNAADFTSSVSPDGKTLQVFQAGNLVITGVLNPLTGQYTLTQNAPIDHLPGGDENEVKFQFKYDVTDGDGDVAPGYIWVNVDDDTPTGGAGTTAWLNDDALTGGNPGGTGDNGLANTSNVLKHSFGADGAGSIAWTGISVVGGGNAADFTSSVSPDGKTLQVFQAGNLVITGVLNPLTGQYTLTQNAPIDHLPGGDENEVKFQFKYDVTDGDGDVAPGYIWVNVDDDTPTGGAGTTAWLNDDTLSGGNPGGAGDHGLANTTNVLKHSFGADGPGGIAWTGISVTGGGNQADFASTVSADGKTMQVYQGNTLVITAVLNPLTGQYTLTQNAPIDHVKGGDENEVQFQFKYDVTDGDGDVAPGYIWVNVDDDTPMAKGLAEVGSLSETGLPTVSFDFGDLNVSVGADKKGTHVEIGTLNGQPIINSNLTSDGVPLEYIVRTTNGVDQELVAFKAGSTADNPVFIVAVLHPGSFATTLFQNLDHLGSNDDVLALNLVARVFDGDGDYVDQPFTINVNDSEPTAIDLTSVMDENQSIEIALTEGTHFSFGADTTGTALSIGAVTLSDGPSGVTLGTPSVTFDPSTNKISIVPGAAFDALAAGQTVVLHIPYTVKDGDNDTITKDIAVTVTGTNDAPVITVASGDSAASELRETDAGLAATGALTVTDVDVTDVVTAAVTFLEVSGPDYGTNLTHQELNSYFKVTPGTVLDGSQTSGSLTWKFDSENQAFDFLAANTRLVLKYTITVTDSSGATDTQIVEIGINGTNDLPTISASVPVHLVEEGYQQAGVASSSATLTIDDVDGTASYDANALSTGGWTAGNDGTWTKTGAYGVATLSAGTNTITYVLNNSLANSLGVNDHPQETFTVPVQDSKGAVASINVSFIIDGTNDAPVVSGAVTGAVTEGGVSSTLNALANATDPEGSPLSVINIAALPAGVTYDVATKSFTLDPTHSAYASLAAGAQTTVTVSYQVSDGAAATPAEVSWVVTGIANNAAPTVVGEAIYINSYDTKIPDWVLLLNDSDPNAGDVLSVSAVPGSAALFDSVNDTGTTTTYTDSSTLFGADPGGSFQYTVSDGNGGTSSPATASLTRVFGSTIETGNGDSIAVGGDWDDTIKGGNGKDVLVGGAGNDTLNGGNASDILYGGLGADRLTGGNGPDTFKFDAGDSGATSLSLGTIFSAGSVSGYDTVVDFKNIDKLDLPVTPIVAANTVGRVNGADAVGSTGFLSSPVTVSYHSITNGVITFYSASSGGVISINSNATLAAVAKYLQSNDLGEAGTTVAFKTDFLEGNADDTFIYQQVGDTPDPQRDMLIGLADVTISDLNTLVANGQVDPIILDLDKNGFAFSSIDNGVTFDINADGKADQIAWTSDDGILAYDVDGNGLIDNGSEIFTPNFNGGAYASGVAALASLDLNGDGKIDANDAAFEKLSIWVDANNNGVSDEGELSSLTDHGVTSISLTTDQTGGTEDDQTIFAAGEFTFADGSTGNFVEVGFETIFGSDMSDALTVIGTDGDDILHGGMGQVLMTGGAGADTFVFDETALSELDVADVITDFSTEEGDVLDVTALLDSLLGEQATAETAASHLRTTVEDGNTTVSVQTGVDTWKDVVVLHNHDTAVKILFDDKHASTIVHD
ncbi:DUF5801 domain-containing protein (plasmid) [Rhizobium sp. SSM4.3]|uniref:DUF5801 domain-containing protein n=1 Tax=Peteryoungia algae TaxID=2919917 RepID=A0ABT0CVR5_9HYPH|nr:DUF5801 repeats-in-toxin domain-containing protein [Rhizobium sp. SSM4.3]MCJ8237261.1 DUF5801 domain-containing protein [Rhizobium sp. SSM4.3]